MQRNLWWLTCVVFLVSRHGLAADGIISGTVRDVETSQPLEGAAIVVTGTGLGASTASDGYFLIQDVGSGFVSLRATLIGYASVDTLISIAPGGSVHLSLALIPDHVETEAVVVTGTRTIRNIEDVPVRVEAIPQEEVEEKLLMTPSSVAMLLNESTGMRIQTTSATSNSANLRIQGLSGRYTQLLVDGVPAFGGLSAGFGLTQLLPLNLRQVEVIKGATSALYGADAIAGVVNFLTKEPQEEPELSALLNGTTQRGVDVAAFHSRSLPAFGFTAFFSSNHQPLVDVDHDGYADVAAFDRNSLAAKLLLSGEDGFHAKAGFGWLAENRWGGVMNPLPAAQGGTPVYTEAIKTRRLDFSAQADWEVGARGSIGVRVAGARLQRDASYGDTPFLGTQTFLFSDVQYTVTFQRHTVLAGAAFGLDDFDDRTPQVLLSRSHRFSTPALFVQDEFGFAEHWGLVASARLDRHSEFGTFLTPRFSLMYRPTTHLTFRLGGGTGFKAPTVFVEEAEERGFRNVRPLRNATAEKARSISFDVNQRAVLGGVTAIFNAALFLTQVDHALTPDEDSLAADILVLRNASGRMFSRGGEISAKLAYGEVKLSLGYTYLFATQEDEGMRKEIDLNPRHAAGCVVFWENEELDMKGGVEVYWTGRQRVEGNPYRSLTPEYWITGAIAEKGFGIVRIFVNFENILDTRQTRYEPIVTGDPASGNFRILPIYAPLEGRVINGGMRIVL